MAEQTGRPHRPAPYADLTALIDAAGGSAPESRAEIASATAAVLVRAGRERDADDARFVELADRIGLDTLAQLWQDSAPVSLPGALWTLYLLRQWCRSDAAEVGRLWRAGEPLAAADAVVAGLADYVNELAVARVADDVLAGAYRGDLAVALERAAAFFRVVAAGRRELAEAGEIGASECVASGRSASECELATRNERAAADLAAAARLWRAGSLH